jgi:hypothetical protein
MIQADRVFSTPPTNTSPLCPEAAIALPETGRFDADPPQRAPMVGARPSRRSLMQMIVTTAIAGAVVASKPAAAIPIADQRDEASKPKQPKDDEKLLNLAEQYLAAWAELDRRCSIKSRMEEKQFAIKKPEKMKVRAEDSELGIPIFFGKPVSDGDFYTPLDIDRMRKPKWSVGERRDEKDDGFTVTILYVEPAAQARERADEIVAAYDAWKNACKRPRGMLTAEREEEKASRRVCMLEAQITRTKATTLEGLVAKARCIAHLSAAMGGREESAQFAASIADDLLAMNMAS